MQESDFSKYAITVNELYKKLKDNIDILLLDVRTIAEHVEHNLGDLLIPLAELEDRWVELDSRRPMVVYCHSGKRSLEAVKILMRKNFHQLWYLQGGICAWKNKAVDSLEPV